MLAESDLIKRQALYIEHVSQRPVQGPSMVHTNILTLVRDNYYEKKHAALVQKIILSTVKLGYNELYGTANICSL